ncbi:xanthine dehydrogenase small subunit [Sneathiella sp. P13V-1]|uniref:xanthine dehydrogenase small subunit n=1 Tax=Sneathiella sp. P13V-1 TaxID=2697366 RepID=UPI00187B40DB|nr:xanthine dehydrogenase small subunit [Sneathiella sp. P13V-1]MBE7638157.1 xanthine dehydrogenase small subunit [Sneathiella sp. P13V-1]
MRDTIKFVRNGKIQELENVDPTHTLLNYLRYDAGDTGTKEGCAEGDCGACTVLVGELVGDEILYSAVNSCIQFLPMLDGKEIVTVEDIANDPSKPHPVQSAMVEANATQCGFCTPGFVMSLVAERHGANRADVSGLNDVLAGNLCRCTGYGTILDAAQKAAANEEADILDAREDQTVDLLKSLVAEDMLAVDTEGYKFYAPTTEAELEDLLSQHPTATILAGATDVGLWVTKQHRDLPIIIYLGKIESLQELSVSDDSLTIGAGVTYSDAHSTLTEYDADLGELVRRIASTQIRNSGTIGGNIANGSPIGDMPPALIALGATLVLGSREGERSLPLEDFFIEYGKQDRRPDEYVKRIILPSKEADQSFATYKISKRFDQDISAVCAAFSVIIEDGTVQNARICYGGMAGTPARAGGAEKTLIGQEWTLQTVGEAMAEMANDYTPLTDMRASDDYRMQVAQNLLMKFFIESTDAKAKTRILGEEAANA